MNARMKGLSAGLLATTLSMGLATVAAADDPFTEHETILACNVSVRTSPSSYAEVVGSCPAGDRAVILDQRRGWVKIQCGASAGWLTLAELECREARMEPRPEVQRESVLLSCEHDVHVQPTLSSQVLAHLAAGQTCVLLERRGDWLRVDCGATEGWIKLCSGPRVVEVVRDAEPDVLKPPVGGYVYLRSPAAFYTN